MKRKHKMRMKDLELTNQELKAERDTCFDQCQKLNNIIEQQKKDQFKEEDEAKIQASIDQIDPDQARQMIVNLKQSNQQLQKELKTQILQNQLIEEQFMRLRSLTQNLQARLKFLNHQMFLINEEKKGG